jgi:UDP-N-acetylmuramyl tripeptide synthase
MNCIDEQPTDTPSLAASTSSSSERARHEEGIVARAQHTLDHLQASTAILVGGAATSIIRGLHLGGGTSLPGTLARAVDADVAGALSAQLRHGSVVITGTNGKTSTCGLATAVLRSTGLRVWHNREGANLARGITASLIQHASVTGKLHEHGDAAFVFEVDEAAASTVVAELQPRVLVVLNLFRDQLDRYGEVQAVAERWRRMIRTLPPSTTLVLNADDPAVAALADVHVDGAVLYFGIDEVPSAAAGAHWLDVVDTRTCPRCQAPLVYSHRFYSHIGHWTCPACGATRPTLDVRAREITLRGLEQTLFTLILPDGAAETALALPGLYNVYNALAAAGVGVAFEATAAAAHAGLERFRPAFGRAERIQVGARGVGIYLTKNPTGLNEVLRVLAADGVPHYLLLLLNDHIADSQDVSWIWDADLEQMAGLAHSLTVGGDRALDLALRLKYAGVQVDHIEPAVGRALAWALAQLPAGETLYVLPTYTAMLAVRGELERQGYTEHYWGHADE